MGVDVQSRESGVTLPGQWLPERDASAINSGRTADCDGVLADPLSLYHAPAPVGGVDTDERLDHTEESAEDPTSSDTSGSDGSEGNGDSEGDDGGGASRPHSRSRSLLDELDSMAPNVTASARADCPMPALTTSMVEETHKVVSEYMCHCLELSRKNPLTLSVLRLSHAMIAR